MGFAPTMPHKAAGCLTDPPVSLPTAAMHRRPATAALDPPDDPPGIRSSPSGPFHGFFTGPKQL
ncbi:hypothetical protein ANAPH2_00664 [Anaplasma phagocytophilum]|nr:hypothetical protein ANAPH2_00148 [Anaplasma phagocytophilum]SCV63528.1 hypothetical protein ANAPH2_00664 [Anaplasma phagocytophilum]